MGDRVGGWHVHGKHTSSCTHLNHPSPPHLTQVCVWSLGDHVTGLTAEGSSSPSQGSAPRLPARLTLRGHDDTIEDVCWAPASAVELARCEGAQRLGLSIALV